MSMDHRSLVNTNGGMEHRPLANTTTTGDGMDGMEHRPPANTTITDSRSLANTTTTDGGMDGMEHRPLANTTDGDHRPFANNTTTDGGMEHSGLLDDGTTTEMEHYPGYLNGAASKNNKNDIGSSNYDQQIRLNMRIDIIALHQYGEDPEATLNRSYLKAMEMGESVFSAVVQENELPPINQALLLAGSGVDCRQNNDCCSICLEEFKWTTSSRISKLPCSHVYHCHCIIKWLWWSNCCPLCRAAYCRTGRIASSTRRKKLPCLIIVCGLRYCYIPCVCNNWWTE